MQQLGGTHEPIHMQYLCALYRDQFRREELEVCSCVLPKGGAEEVAGNYRICFLWHEWR